MRSLILLLVGLAVGALCTLIAVNTLNRGTPYHHAVMAMMGQQMKSIDKSVKASRCAATDIAPRLQMLRLLANDIEPAFAGVENDAQFNRYAADLRAAADAALNAPPATCPAASATLSSLGKACDACHRDFKS